ncbi:response regulator, partial [Vibrio parahaemolyticus]|nr:response regulator [Vibrio parahaemolyticus]
MKILIIEDNEHKREKVCAFIQSLKYGIELYESASFNSGIKAISKFDLDLIILDMSLPTHDKSANESGGRFRVYGGKDIVRKMRRKSITTPFVILTQYSNFGEGENKK